MDHRLALLFLTLAQHITGLDGIKCYECVHNSQRMKRQQRFVYPCSEFDGTHKFIRDCPDSQLCVYQHITLRLATGPIEVHTMDGCTPNSTQLTRYSEAGLVKAGCIQHISRYKPPSSIYCYCDHHLCNGVPSSSTSGSATTRGAAMVAVIVASAVAIAVNY